MENKIVEATYTEIDTAELQDKSTEELLGEVNSLYDQMEFIGKLGMSFAANAGKRLIEIKSRIAHGQWGDWCENNLKFSKSKAEKMMKLAYKTADENSIFFKSVNFTDLGISKVWALLAAPEEVAEEVVESADIEELSVGELKEEIKVTKTAYEEVLKEREASEKEIALLKRDIKELQEEINLAPPADAAEETEEAKAMLEALNDELGKAQEELKALKAKEKENIKKAKEKLEADKQKEIEKAVEDAKVQALKEASEQTDQMRSAMLDAQEETEKLKKLLENSSNENLIALKVNGTNLQQNFNLCLEKLDKIKEQDPEKGEKMNGYLKAIVGAMVGQLSGKIEW